MEASYFIPGDAFVAELAEMKQRGGRAAVLTNSLATNDVIAAHGAYARYRDGLLKAGVELHELTPNARALHRQVRLFKGAPGPACIPRPWCWTGARSSWAHSISIHDRSISIPRWATTWCLKSWASR